MSTKKRMKVLEPVVRGCNWEGDGSVSDVFQSYAVCLIEPLPKPQTSPSPEELSQKSLREAQCKWVSCDSFKCIRIFEDIQPRTLNCERFTVSVVRLAQLPQVALSAA